MKRLFIIGGTGLLGLNWAFRKRSQWDTCVNIHNQKIHIRDVDTVSVDSNDVDQLGLALDKLKPDLVVNAVGHTNVDECERSPALSLTSNYGAAKSIATAAASRSIPLIHISTDHLFNGTAAYTDELTPPDPINNYAIHKAMAEQAVLECHPEALVIRTTFFGWGPIYRRSLSDKIIDSLKRNRTVSMFDDVFFTPLDTSTLIDLAHQLIEKKYHGVINVCSKQRISKYEFSIELAQYFGFDGSNIQPIQASRLKTQTKRPVDLSLSDNLLRDVLDFDGISLNRTLSSLKHDEVNNGEISRIGKVISYGRHFIDQDDIEAVVSTLKSTWLTQGPAIQSFEDNIANYVGARYAVAVSSATAGLHLSYLALGLKPGSSILTSPITFVSTANAAYFCGGNVRFADIDPTTINMGFSSMKKAIQQYPEIDIVVPVLFSGATEGVPEISKFAKANNKFVVEDAAHALGSSYFCGSKVGSCKYSDCTVFSFHPVKSIAAGEGGIITTNDEQIYKSLLKLRSHGINKGEEKLLCSDQAFTDGTANIWYYEMNQLGYHYRLTDIQASLANSQLKKLDAFLNRRREIAKGYKNTVSTLPFISVAQDIDIEKSANHLFVVKIDFSALGITRNKFMSELKEKNIITQVHYIPVPKHPFYQKLGFNKLKLNNANNFYQEALSLPIYYSLGKDDFDFVIHNIKRLLNCDSKIRYEL